MSTKPNSTAASNVGRASFAFRRSDLKILKYCSKTSGLSQTELIRRYVRIHANGGKFPNLPVIPVMPKLKEISESDLPKDED